MKISKQIGQFMCFANEGLSCCHSVLIAYRMTAVFTALFTIISLLEMIVLLYGLNITETSYLFHSYRI